jgi:hypothetical protein
VAEAWVDGELFWWNIFAPRKDRNSFEWKTTDGTDSPIFKISGANECAICWQAQVKLFPDDAPHSTHSNVKTTGRMEFAQRTSISGYETEEFG